jgi:TatD DNase family protein
MIDVHCHFDLAKNPGRYIADNERKRIITIGMTNLPSHFLMGVNHVKEYKYIRLAVGLHPLKAEAHGKEYSKFSEYTNQTSYIGEVGLDFSMEGISTKELQIDSFEFVLDCVKNKPKILSLHSRKAEKETLEMLIIKKIKNAIFHWYSGSLSILNKIIYSGYYFSINSAMMMSENGKKIIKMIPKDMILTETDFPFIDGSNILLIYRHLSVQWGVSEFEVENMIDSNFKRLIQNIS